jgi:hypothetical protein
MKSLELILSEFKHELIDPRKSLRERCCAERRPAANKFW